jgi:hypothetical protein
LRFDIESIIIEPTILVLEALQAKPGVTYTVQLVAESSRGELSANLAR